MATALRCSDLKKVYPNQDYPALDGVSFEVEDGELFALLGPSGCGKTTTLRLIGGFLEADAGSVEIQGKDVTQDPPYARPTNTVFQAYALFPHMNVSSNVEFGLKMEGVGGAERAKRVGDALRLVGLEEMARRRINELSGGQQQRAALARAIVKNPAVLLLDEPFGALDLKLRRQMQDEIVQLKRSMRTTFVHVTHDQEEACAIADRIAVMQEGKIVQVDSPLELYRSPQTTYVAEFIDAGTIIRGDVHRSDRYVEISRDDVVVRAPRPRKLNSNHVAALIPHERVRVLPPQYPDAESAPVAATGVIDRTVFTGSVFDLYVTLGADIEMHATVTPDDVAERGDDWLRVGQRVDLSWRPEEVVVLEDAG